jgi:hypothetical protein
MTDNNCPAPWRNPRVLLTLGLVFLCGLTAGGLVMRFSVHQAMHTPEPYWQEGGKEISLQRLSNELDLTPAQRQHLEMVLDDFMMYVQTLQSQMDEVRALGKDRILRILDDEQKGKFEEMLGELQAKGVR